MGIFPNFRGGNKPHLKPPPNPGNVPPIKIHKDDRFQGDDCENPWLAPQVFQLQVHQRSWVISVDDQVVGLLWMVFFPGPKKNGWVCISLVVVSLVPCVCVLLVVCVCVCEMRHFFGKVAAHRYEVYGHPKFAPGEAVE